MGQGASPASVAASSISTKSGHSAALTDLGDKTITASLSYIPAEDLSPSPFRYKLRKECHCLPSLRQEQVDSLAGSEDRIAADPLTTDSNKGKKLLACLLADPTSPLIFLLTNPTSYKCSPLSDTRT